MSTRERIEAEKVRPPRPAQYPATTGLDVAIEIALQQVEEWDYAADKYGWCHQRPILLTLIDALTEADDL